MSLFHRHTGLRLALALAGSLAVSVAATAATRHPLSCKPLPPAEVELRLVSRAAGGPATIEAQVSAFRPLEDVRLDLTLPANDAAPGEAVRSLGRIDSGSKRALTFHASIPPAGRSEVYARITFRMPGGEIMTSAAHLSFADGQPAPAPTYRTSHWNGSVVLETPAGGIR
jgi:hypothetical protein